MTLKQNANSSIIKYLALLMLVTMAPASAQDAPKEDAAGNTAQTPANSEGATKTDAAPAKPTGHVHPQAAREHYNRGVELHRSGHLNKAILEYKEAIAADEHMEPAYSNLGLVYTAQKSWSKALEAFDKALAMKPDRTTSLNGLGTVLYAMKRNDEAMEKWRKAIEIDPNFASAYYNMGNAYESQEKHKEALQSYVKAADINPKMADAYYRLGSLMNKTKHAPQAHVLLNKAIKLAPDAEFAKDAKRQIDGLEKIFEKDGAQLSATADSEPEQKTSTSSSADSKPKAVAAGSSDIKGEKKDPTKIIKNMFKRSGGTKDDKSKNVNMFVQPPSPESDLKAKPE